MADPNRLIVKRWQGGQVLAFVAVALPAVLLPVAAYAVDSATISARAAGLEGATAQSAEAAAEQVDVAGLRADGVLSLDATQAQVAAAQTLEGEEPGAVLERMTASGRTVTVAAYEVVELPFPVLARAVTLRATATARLVPGYARPSSFFPLPTSNF